MNSSYTKRFSSFEDAESHCGLSLSDTLAELVINRRKPGRPINTGSGITKQAPLQSELPQPELPQPMSEFLPPESPQVVSPPALPIVESLLKLACCLKDNDLEELTNKLFHQLTLAHNLTSNPLNSAHCLSMQWNC